MYLGYLYYVLNEVILELHGAESTVSLPDLRLQQYNLSRPPREMVEMMTEVF